MRAVIAQARRFLTLPIVPGWRTRFGDLLLIVAFSALSSLEVLASFVNWSLGWDGIIYTWAARALLAGGDPWGPAGGSALFAGPPPSLLPHLPFVWLPDPIVAVAWPVVALASGVYVLRKLGLPLWWLTFPPVVLAILSGSTALPVTALIVRGGALAEGAAVALRPYAAVPLAILGRWRAFVAAIGIVVVTAPFLDWPGFTAALDTLGAVLDDQTLGGRSAAAVPWLIPIAVACLFMLGRHRAAWLIVPALWPYTQTYYAVLAMPVVAQVPLVALALAVDLPGFVVAGLLAQVAVERLTGSRLRTVVASWLPSPAFELSPTPSLGRGAERRAGPERPPSAGPG
jgi:hypothetical protein